MCGMMVLEGRSSQGLQVQADLMKMSKTSVLMALVAALPTAVKAMNDLNPDIQIYKDFENEICDANYIPENSESEYGYLTVISALIAMFILGLLAGIRANKIYRLFYPDQIDESRGDEMTMIPDNDPTLTRESRQVFVSTSKMIGLRYHTRLDCKALKKVKKTQGYDLCELCRKRG